MIVEIKEKSVYGNVLLYPNNVTASQFAQLIGKKTFAQSDLKLIEAMGYKINYQSL